MNCQTKIQRRIAKLLWYSLAVILGTVALTLRPAVRAETIDQVVASVDNIAITQADVDHQYRLELFLNGSQPQSPPPSAREEVRDRLLNQLLLTQEVEAEGGDLPDFSDQAEKAWNEIRNKFESEQAFQSALTKLGMQPQEVVKQLREQERTLYVIDERLRPAAWVESSEIKDYYDKTFVPDYERGNPARPPALEDVESRIREILIQKKINAMLPALMRDLRIGRRVKIHSF